MGSFQNKLRARFFEPLYFYLNHSPIPEYTALLEKSQFLSEDELRSIQWKRLKKILSFAHLNSAFYHQRFSMTGIAPHDIKNYAAFRSIPILTKKDVRNNTLNMISNRFSVHNLLHFKTGGSTGKALDLYFTEKCSELRNACARRHDRWSGWQPGEPIAAVWGNPEFPKTVKEKFKSWLLNPIVYLDTMAVNKAAVLNFADEWDKVKPTLVLDTPTQFLYWLNTFKNSMFIIFNLKV